MNNNITDTQKEIANINTHKMYRVEIVTQDSTIISESTDKANIVCNVYSWDVNITDSLNAGMFNWKRISSNEDADEIWNNMPEHQGVKSITINANDVIGNSSFYCEVNLPGNDPEQPDREQKEEEEEPNVETI